MIPSKEERKKSIKLANAVRMFATLTDFEKELMFCYLVGLSGEQYDKIFEEMNGLRGLFE